MQENYGDDCIVAGARRVTNGVWGAVSRGQGIPVPAVLGARVVITHVPSILSLNTGDSALPRPQQNSSSRMEPMDSSRQGNALLGTSIASFVAGALLTHWLASRRRRWDEISNEHLAADTGIPCFLCSWYKYQVHCCAPPIPRYCTSSRTAVDEHVYSETRLTPVDLSHIDDPIIHTPYTVLLYCIDVYTHGENGVS